MRNEDVIAKAFGDKVDKIVKDFDFSVKQLIEHKKRLEEIYEQIRSQQGGSRKNLQ